MKRLDFSYPLTRKPNSLLSFFSLFLLLLAFVLMPALRTVRTGGGAVIAELLIFPRLLSKDGRVGGDARPYHMVTGVPIYHQMEKKNGRNP